MEAAFASGFASTLLEVFFGNLKEYLSDIYQKIKQHEANLADLEVPVVDVCSLLDNLNQWEYSGNKLLDDRVEDLIGLCYDTEDLMDELLINQYQNAGSGMTWEWFLNNSLRTKFVFRAPKVSKLVKKLEELQIHLDILRGVAGKGNSDGNLQPAQWEWESSFTSPANFTGRDHDVQEICSELLSLETKNCGVSIVGMHGVGKTALAETIFCQPCILGNFPLRFKISVPNGVFDPYAAIWGLQKLLKGCEEEKQGCQKLLLMLDNLMLLTKDGASWHTFWEEINRNRTADVKLLVTTLNTSVSKLTGTKAHDLKPLGEEDCAEVIMASACASQQTKLLFDKRLQPIARELVKNCEGLPELAQIMGFTAGQWGDPLWSLLLEQKSLWTLDKFRKDMLPKIWLSYRHMHPTSKKCFAYLSLFPHNYQLDLDNLFQLWEAEGFFPPSNGPSTSLQTRFNCMDDLLGRSFLQCSGGEKTNYKVPCLIHQFAHFVASDTCLLLDRDEAGESISTAKTRHLSLLRVEADSPIWFNKKLSKKLRTILSLHKDGQPIVQAVEFPNNPDTANKFLLAAINIRVLALNGTNVVELPEKINELVHLRYIDISNTVIKKLPEKLCQLLSLQFLNLKNTKVKHFPQRISDLINLMWLYWDTDKVDPPANIGKLKNLQILPFFRVGPWGNFIEELGNLNRLQSSICITGLENIMSGNVAKQAKLHEKPLLTEIELLWDRRAPSESIAFQVLSALQPEDTLLKLKITRYRAQEFPAWISNKDFMLARLHLYQCDCKQLPVLGQLKALKSLIIEGMSNLTKVDKSFCRQSQDTEWNASFPSLELLEFNDIAELQQWIELEQDDMPCLRKLRFINCPKMMEFPSLENHHSLKKLKINGCQALETLPNLPKSLNSLVIEDGRKLEKNYGLGGTKYEEIKKIPRVIINHVNIQEVRDLTDFLQDVQVTEHPVHVDQKAEFPEDNKAQLDAEEDLYETEGGSYFNLKTQTDGGSGHSMGRDSMSRDLDIYFDANEELDIESMTRCRVTEEHRSLEEMKLHCLVFPKDYEFGSDTLIQLWMAAGFLTSSLEEENGTSCFNILLSEEFILLSRMDILTGKGMYRVNVVKVRNHVSGMIEDKECRYAMLKDETTEADLSNALHVSVVSNHIDQTTFQKLERIRELKTLIFVFNGCRSLKQVPYSMFSALGSMQAVDLSRSHITELPSSIGNMRCLRYLNLSFTPIERLPDSIDRLKELQTLKLKGCKQLCALPEGTKELVSLCYLEFDVFGRLTCMPRGIGGLTELRTLSAFIPGSSGKDCDLEELPCLKNLRGSLCISGLERVSKRPGYHLIDDLQITHLKLQWSNFESSDQSVADTILEHLRPSRLRLEELHILSFPGSELPPWMGSDMFEKLVHISLVKCENGNLNTTLGKLPNLKYLSITQMNRVTEISKDFRGNSQVGFPKLEELVINGMLGLQYWTGVESQDFPLVKKVTVMRCPNLSSLLFLPFMPFLNYLEISTCELLESLPAVLSTSLTTLIINDCNRLKPRCSNDSAEDWHKIQHVPLIWIDQIDIHSPGDDSDDEDDEKPIPDGGSGHSMEHDSMSGDLDTDFDANEEQDQESN